MITGEPSYITDGKCVMVFFLGFFICPLVLVEKKRAGIFSAAFVEDLWGGSGGDWITELLFCSCIYYTEVLMLWFDNDKTKSTLNFNSVSPFLIQKGFLLTSPHFC